MQYQNSDLRLASQYRKKSLIDDSLIDTSYELNRKRLSEYVASHSIPITDQSHFRPQARRDFNKNKEYGLGWDGYRTVSIREKHKNYDDLLQADRLIRVMYEQLKRRNKRSYQFREYDRQQDSDF